ncbi:hypothetical protein IID24_00595, partial [Patescibacteria group bacterium]|nr:hypothetical protein [Patescibacteria group bacterium]
MRESAPLQTFWYYVVACFTLILIEFRIRNKETGLLVTGQAEGSVAMIAARCGILEEMNEKTWRWTEEAYRRKNLPISIVRPVDLQRINVFRRKDTPQRSILQIRVVKMQIQARIRARQEAFFFEATDMSRFEYRSWILLFQMRLQKTWTPDQLGAAWRILETEEIPLRAKFSQRFRYAAGYIAHLERSKCCPDWSSWPAERIRDEFPTIREALSFLRDSLNLAVHQLCCRKIRLRWTYEGKQLGFWRDFLDKTGTPFFYLGNRFVKPSKAAQASARDIYTIEMLQELIDVMKEGKLKRSFLLECILTYGIFLCPEDYITLTKVVEEKELKPDALQKAAWLYHMNVSVSDMLLCVALMPFTRDFPQARELAKEGVLPELMQELRSADLLSLRSPQIRYI